MPLLLLIVHEDGTLTVTLDHRPVEPPAFAPGWRRSMFAQIVDQVTHHRSWPVRVEVRESNGTVFTDILTATKRSPEPDPAPEPAPAPKRKRARMPVEVNGGDGFVAGEDVAIGLITGHTDASHTGHVRALLDPDVIDAAEAHEVVLVGRVSGTLAIRVLS